MDPRASTTDLPHHDGKRHRYSVVVRVEFIVEIDAVDEDEATAQAEDIVDHSLLHGEGGTGETEQWEVQNDSTADLKGDD